MADERAPIVRHLEHLGLKSAVGRVRRAAGDARRTQLRVLRAIVDASVDSEFGRRCRLRGVDSIESFRAAVPVSTREESSFDRARCTAGHPDVLFDGAAVGVRVAATIGARDRRAADEASATRSESPDGPGPAVAPDAAASRTTGSAGALRPPRPDITAAVREPRLVVPISPRCRGRAARDAAAAWFGRTLRHHPTMLDGLVLLVPPIAPTVAAGATDALAGAPAGTRFSHLGDVLPASVRRRLVADPAVSAIADPGVRARAMMRLALARPVTAVIGGTPSDLAMIFQAADDVSERLIRDVRNGTLDVIAGEDGADADIAPDLRARLAEQIEPDKQRARALERARSNRGGHLLPVDVWPLVTVGCLGQSRGRGGAPDALAMAGQSPAPSPAASVQLSPWLDPAARGEHAAIHDLGWMTAEAWTTLGGPSQADAPPAGDTPLTELAFHEFVDRRAMLDDPERPERWTFVGLDELEPDVEYVDFVTTTGGLFRHETCDCVVRTDDESVRLAHVGRVEGIFASIP